MCLHARRSFGEVEAGARFEPSYYFAFDEIGQVYSDVGFCYLMPAVAKYFGAQIISYHDRCEDG